MLPCNPTISIITPSFQRAATLARAIRSVQAQSFTDYEHLIIDDGSTDGTRELIRQIADPRIRYIRFDSWQGANAARNAGIEAAQASWLTFLDSDDAFLPHRLQATVNRIEQSDVTPLIISSFQVQKPGKISQSINPSRILNGSQLERALMAYKIFIAGSAITVRADKIREIGGFHPSIMRLQDREVLLRLSAVTDAQLLSDVDWVKHTSHDSISAAPSGYVASLAAMLKVNPHLCQRYRRLIAFQVARAVLRELLHGRVDVAGESLKVNYESPELGFTFVELLREYLLCHRDRKIMAQILSKTSSELSPSLPSKPSMNTSKQDLIGSC
ncbi:MAG: hypothetical protein RLY14_3305 [Planctomycetota bacterium]|jgi:glycosyltransferase involved in cell wall biosynthesis